jgi:thioredoxin reductase (NADPH)
MRPTSPSMAEASVERLMNPAGVFTREELRGIPLFCDLQDDELDLLARTSADIHLLPGEYILHEGEMRRALFILVSGSIDVTKLVDGVERVVGTRGPGESFGELPLVFSAPYAVNFRAAETARIVRTEARDFYAVAATSPHIASEIGKIALDRLEALRDLAMPKQPALTVVGPQFDNATHELREFLERNSIEYDWQLPSDAGAASPAVQVRDGATLVHPTIREVAKAAGLCVVPSRQTYDVAIIGGGPAGLAAAVYGASEGLSTVLIEKEAPGGQAGTSSRIENYLGFPFGISGDELAQRALEQARRLGADVAVTRNALEIDASSRTIFLDEDGTVQARAIIIATGVAWRQLSVPSVDELIGCGVYYGTAPGEARFVLGGKAFLVGGGNSAGQAAINLSNFAESVTLLVRGDSLEKSMSYYLIEQLKNKQNVTVRTQSEVVDAFGDKHLETIAIADRSSGTTTRHDASALFVLIGADAETAWLPPEIVRDENGYVLTGAKVLDCCPWPLQRQPFLLETTVPGIFAAGDVRAGSIKRVATAVGEGSMAIAFVHQYLG